MDAQKKRQQEIENYQTHLSEVEDWLNTILKQLKDLDKIQDEKELNSQLKAAQNVIGKIKDKQESLLKLLEKTKVLEQHPDVRDLATSLTEQLTVIINLLREQVVTFTNRVHIIEMRIIEIQKAKEKEQMEKEKERAKEQEPEPVSTASTIDSSPMPEEEIKSQVKQPLTAFVETQTSESLLIAKEMKPELNEMEAQTSFPLEPVPVEIETFDMSVQTQKERKPTENISVVQKMQEGKETIQIDRSLNKEILETPEDVLVEARYHHLPREDVKRATELVLKNIPESFETTFIEPDETTTEVVVDPDGTKRIIVKKVTRTRHEVVQRTQQQQISSISPSSGEDNNPVIQSQINLESREVAETTSGDNGSKTVVTSQSKGSVAEMKPEGVVFHEFEGEPQMKEFITGEGFNTREILLEGPLVGQQSSISAVVQQVTRKVIRKARKIIKRVVIIDGKEHVTEEVVEEPEEIEITEEELPPRVNVNIIRTINGQVVSEEEYARFMQQQGRHPEEPGLSIEEIETTMGKPVAQQVKMISEQLTLPVDTLVEDIKKSEEDIKKDKAQVLEFDTAPVELRFDKAPIVDVTETTSTNVTEIALEKISPSAQEQIVEKVVEKLPEEVLVNVTDVWPIDHHLHPTMVELVERQDVAAVPFTEIVGKLPVETYKDIQEVKEIWPASDQTGNHIDLVTVQYEQPEKPKPMTEPIEKVEDKLPDRIEESLYIDMRQPQEIPSPVEDSQL